MHNASTIPDVAPTCSKRVLVSRGTNDLVIGVPSHMDCCSYLRLASLPTFLGPAPSFDPIRILRYCTSSP